MAVSRLGLIVLSLLVNQGWGKGIFNFNEVLEDCHFNGMTYKPGQSIPTEDKCITCSCPVTGAPARCTGYFCSPTPCVNPVILQGECCPQCLEGENCWLNDRVIPANHYIVLPMGFGCTAVCRCPGPSSYLKHGIETTAICENPCRYKK